jgi:serine phosphatase RsbU (regulator of sigma subunit)
VLLVLILNFYAITFFYINSIFKSLDKSGIVFLDKEPLGFLANLLLAVLMLLFGLLLILNSQSKGKLIADEAEERSFQGRYKQGFLLVYIVVGYFAHMLIFFEHAYYLYFLQFILILILLNKTTWLERLTKNELWVYFAIFFVIYYLYNDPARFQNMKLIDAHQKATWFTVPYYLHFLIKTYFLVLLIKIPIVLIYNHAGLERKLKIAGMFQSTFPQLIQFVFLICIFFFFISGWQSDKLRETILMHVEKNQQGDFVQYDTYFEVPIRPGTQTLRIAGYHPAQLPAVYPAQGVLKLDKLSESSTDQYVREHYFLYSVGPDSLARTLTLIKIDTSLATSITRNLSVLAGTGVILYPYTPRAWQDFLYNRDFLQDRSSARIYPFDVSSENQTVSYVSRIDEKEDKASALKAKITGYEDIFGSQKFTVGRVFFPIVIPDAANSKYFAFDVYLAIRTSPSNVALAKIVMVLVGLFFLLNILVIRRVGKFGEQINKIIVQKFTLLKKGIREISSGNLDYKFKMEGEDEFVELAGHFNQMGDKLKKTISDVREKDRLDHELKIARQVQLNLLPAKLPQIEGYQISAALKTANEVGGDLYDLITIDKNKYLFTIGDVSGKGSSAAFYMAQFISLLRFSPQFTAKPMDIALRLNKYFSTQIVDRQIFITAIVGILDLTTNSISFVRAGHTLPILIPGDKSKQIEEINTDGLGIGLTKTQQMFKKSLKVGSVKLQDGDMFVLYTDGVVEAAIPGAIGQEVDVFGDDRFKELLLKSRGQNAHKLLVTVTNELNTFYSHHPRVDDHTMFIIQKSQHN